MLASLVTMAVLVAGCAAPEATPVPGENGQPEASTPEGMGGDAGLAPGAAPAPTAVGVLQTPVSFEGATDLSACAFAAGQGQCQTPMQGENDFVELEFPGDPLRLVAQVTWSAQTPAGERLRVLLASGDGDGGWSYSSDTDPSADGTSPLSLDWDLTQYAGKDLYVIINSNTGQYVPMVGGASLEDNQAFTFEGVLTSLDPEAAPTAVPTEAA